MIRELPEMLETKTLISVPLAVPSGDSICTFYAELYSNTPGLKFKLFFLLNLSVINATASNQSDSPFIQGTQVMYG